MGEPDGRSVRERMIRGFFVAGTEYVGVNRAQSAARSEPRFPNGTDSPDRD
jgi:hypothetical protein